jgi:hypothetical protein
VSNTGVVTGVSAGVDTIKYIVTNVCGTAVTYKVITINPLPLMLSTVDQTICNNSPQSAIAFLGTQSPTYKWTNNNTSIGLADSGIANIPSFIASNNSSSVTSATIIVTPTSSLGCIGISDTFTIAVNPLPTINMVNNVNYCSNEITSAIVFTGPTLSSVFSWTNDNTGIGVAASGTSNIPSFTATNTGATPVTATIIVTPTAATCIGTKDTFNIIINPTPNVAATTDQIVCNNSATTAVTLSGSLSGTIFNWTNNKASVGLGASGSGNIPSFNATNFLFEFI